MRQARTIRSTQATGPRRWTAETEVLKHLLLLFLLLAVLGTSPPALARDEIVVMTQNQYLGADYTTVVRAPDPIAFRQAVLDALAQVAANNFPERATALAAEIAARQPHLVGLQEVYNFQLDGQNGPPPYRDHLADTLDALVTLGASYVPVASVQNLNLTLEDLAPDVRRVSITDRDVILARADIAAAVTVVPFSQFCTQPSEDGCNYQFFVTAETVAGPIEIKRGFVGVDVTIGGKPYRFVNTHLEVREPDPNNPGSRAVQAAQAAELIAVLHGTMLRDPERTVLIVGDINSSPDDLPLTVGSFTIVPPYELFVAAGFTDTWEARPGKAPGLTCCQRPDLSNHRSILDERIDVIFSSEVPRKVQARVLGDRIADKTSLSRLWPSDHGAVVAPLEFD